MTDPFGFYARYYDLLYKDKDYQSEADYVKSLLRSHKIPGSRILEFGAGTGIHAGLLKKTGFDIQGIEKSKTMIAMAKEADRISLLEGDIRNKRVPGIFDGVISLFHVMSYQCCDADVAAVFANAENHLKTGGLFLFDFWHTPAVLIQKPEVREKVLRSSEIEVSRRAIPKQRLGKNIVDVHYQVKIRELASGKTHEFDEIHSMRHFTIKELDEFAKSSGMVRLLSEEFGTGKRPGEETWGVCNLYRKGTP